MTIPVVAVPIVAAPEVAVQSPLLAANPEESTSLGLCHSYWCCLAYNSHVLCIAECAMHAAGEHFSGAVGSGCRMEDRDKDIAASLALSEGQIGSCSMSLLIVFLIFLIDSAYSISLALMF